MAFFPMSVNEVTGDWLSEVLGYPAELKDIRPLGEGFGVLSLVSRIKLDSALGPKSLIAKLPSPVPENRDVAREYDNYGREYRFYTEVAPTIPVRSAKCHYGAFEHDSYKFVLLLEDLQEYRLGDQVKGCSEQDVRMVINTIAQLHANTWRATGYKGVANHNSAMQRDAVKSGFEMGWPVVLDQFADLVPGAARSVGEKIPGALGRLMDEFSKEPLCVAHGDVRLDNIFFGENEVVFVDWQAVCHSAPEHDLAYFLTQSVPTDIREKEDWVAIYHQALTDQGTEYSLNTCRDRYQKCALYLLSYAVIIAGILDMGNERGMALARTLLGNSLGSLTSLGAFDLVS